MRVGVLALQGAFIEHESRIAELGATPFEIRTRTDVESPFDGLILPGVKEDGTPNDIIVTQFEINDSRSFETMYQDIQSEGLQPVLNDYLYV